MYLNIRVGVRPNKAGRPPLRLAVGSVEAHGQQVEYSGGDRSRPWRVRVAFDLGAAADLEQLVSAYELALGAHRERAPVRVPGRVAVMGPRHTLRGAEARKNVTKRLYADGLCIHRQAETVIARWFDGSTAFEMSGDDEGWATYFAGLRACGELPAAIPSTTNPSADPHACAFDMSESGIV